MEARDKLAACQRRCAKLEKDAARYKWVRANMEECETLFKEWLSQPDYEEAARALDTTADAFLAASERRCADLQAKGEEDLKLCYREMDADSNEIEHLHAQIAELQATVARLERAHERAHSEVLRLSELLRKADPEWNSPMRLAALDAQEPSK